MAKLPHRLYTKEEKELDERLLGEAEAEDRELKAQRLKEKLLQSSMCKKRGALTEDEKEIEEHEAKKQKRQELKIQQKADRLKEKLLQSSLCKPQLDPCPFVL